MKKWILGTALMLGGFFILTTGSVALADATDETPLSATPRYTEQNGLRNGDFESGLSYWQSEGNASVGVDSPNAYQGQKLYIFRSGTINHRVYQKVTLPNGIYEVSAMVKTETMHPAANRMELNTQNGKSVVAFGQSQDYQRISKKVEVTDGTLEIGFRSHSEVNTLNGMLVDNVQLVKSTGPLDEPLLLNGDFELGLDHWQASGSGGYGVDLHDAYLGYKLWLYDSVAFDRTISQDISLANGVYTVSAMVKCTSPMVSSVMRVTTSDYTQEVPLPVGNSYSKISTKVLVLNGRMTVAFRGKGNPYSGFIVDNVIVERG